MKFFLVEWFLCSREDDVFVICWMEVIFKSSQTIAKCELLARCNFFSGKIKITKKSSRQKKKIQQSTMQFFHPSNATFFYLKNATKIAAKCD